MRPVDAIRRGRKRTPRYGATQQCDPQGRLHHGNASDHDRTWRRVCQPFRHPRRENRQNPRPRQRNRIIHLDRPLRRPVPTRTATATRTRHAAGTHRRLRAHRRADRHRHLSHELGQPRLGRDHRRRPATPKPRRSSRHMARRTAQSARPMARHTAQPSARARARRPAAQLHRRRPGPRSSRRGRQSSPRRHVAAQRPAEPRPGRVQTLGRGEQP